MPQPYAARVRKRHEFIAFLAVPLTLVGLIGSRFGIPWGPFFYLALLCLTYVIDDQMHPRYGQAQAEKAALKRPRLKWWPKDSTIRTVELDAVDAVIGATLLSLIPQPLPLISWLFAYAAIRAEFQSIKNLGYEETPYPPVTVFGEKGFHLQPRVKFGPARWPLLSTLVLLALLALAGATLAGATAWTAVHLWGKWVPSKPLVHILAFWCGIHWAHFRVGPLHLWQWAEITGLAALSVAVACWTSWVRADQIKPWVEAQKEKLQWDQRWQAVLKGANPPAYQGKIELPEMSPTHVKAVFQIDAGAEFSTYANSAPKLASTMGPDMVLVEPMPMVGPDGTPLPGTVQMLGFTVTYALSPMGDRPWARADLDDQTLEFGARWGFQRAFRELKLGTPNWAALRVLRRPLQHPEDLLVETLWRLPHGVPLDTFAHRTLDIQEKMDVRWLRVGRRLKGPDWASELVSVCYSDNPDLNVGLRPVDVEFLNGIEWEQCFRAVSLCGTGGVMPPYRDSEDTEQGLQAHSFGAAPGLPWEKIQQAKPALIPTLRYHYVQVEQTDEAGGFRIICGEADPLDRDYLFRDWASITMGVPGPKPQMDFYVGIGADGAPVRFAFDDESPHLIVAGASLALGTPVPRADGTWTTMGDIRQGERILGEDGKPCAVTNLYAVYYPDRCYRLTFDDGTSVEASDTHRWSVARVAGPATGDESTPGSLLTPPQTVTTQQIFDGLSARALGFAIRLAPPLQFSDRPELPALDPYTLGAWLGGGCPGTGVVSSPGQDAVRRVAKGYLVTRIWEEVRPDGRLWHSAELEGLPARLQGIDVFDRPHIPEAYLRAGHAERLDLLQGLLDTAGGSTPEVGEYTLRHSEKAVIEGARRLLWSLGAKPVLTTGQADPELPAGCYGLRFVDPELSAVVPYRYVTSCEPIPVQPMRCISVDSPNHLFLVGEMFMSTSNSGMGKCIALGTVLVKTDGTTTTMRDVVPGDRLFDEQGRPCQVSRVYDVEMPATCYELELEHGELLRVSGNHRWPVWDEPARAQLLAAGAKADGQRGPVLRTTEEIAELLAQGERPALAVAPALTGVHDTELPLDPYALGVWLAVGQVGTGSVGQLGWDSTALDELGLLYPYSVPGAEPVGTAVSYCVAVYTGLRQDLERAGVLRRKHIPARYFAASTAQRRALLQGLMDACGLVMHTLAGQAAGLGADIPVCLWRHDSMVLTREVCRLVRSLGLKTASPVPWGNDGQERPGGQLVFIATADDKPFRVSERARELPVVVPGDAHRWHYVKAVRPTGRIPMRCVEVDSPDHLFLCSEDLVVTHNSAFLHSMVLQLATKNTPEQWELRIAEPKNELQRYKALPHVTRFVDMRTPAPNIFAPVADMLEELKEEMERRYALFERLPTRPSKLEQALEDPALQDRLPYITCLIEECADYFVEPKRRDQKEDYGRLMEPLEWLSRKARGAGIYLVVCTQRPTKNNLPTQVKANSRKIGFGTSTSVDSLIIIDQLGLELIHTKGRGLVSAFKGYRGFRGFFLDDGPTGRNDLRRYLTPLCVLSADRLLGPTCDTSSQWPPAFPVSAGARTAEDK
jgi:hypothetical protein